MKTRMKGFQQKAEKKEQLLTGLVISIVLLRFVFVFIMGPMPQDAYYFFYSQHPALSYFDHPPMIAYLLSMFTTVLGKNIIAIKFADTCTTLAGIALFYQLGKCFLEGQKLTNALYLLLSTLMVTILSLVSTPDTPLVLFWTWSLCLIYQAIFKDKPVYWLWSGIVMGLTFDSKYTAILLPAGVILFLLLSPAYRRSLLSVWFWLSVISFFIVISPVIVWNAQHHFASFKFQGASRVNDTTGIHIQLKYFFGLIGHQLLVVMPVLLIAIFYYTFRVSKKRQFSFPRIEPKTLFLLCFFLPMICGFTFVSFFCWVKLNWLMPAYITGTILAAGYLPRKWVTYQVYLSLVIHLLLVVEIILYPFPVQSDDTWFGWQDLAAQVTQLKKTYPKTFVFSADGYKTSAELNLLMKGFTYSQNVIGENALQFDYVNADLSVLHGKDALFIDSDPHFKNEEKSNQPNGSLLHYFSSVKELQPIIIRKNGKAVRKFLVYYCSNYAITNL
ncbi:glycosyltransferase family 39 protein [Pedobacter sp. L105]|uniref:ArnT family glycosyltransferase n=1 Tax=Pedobacter sp. L105 TaxID=1641871 RepID=UPI00131E2D25|nr:glycosyltransferase family 39 protein [Pedobacter sp. L105]